LTPSGDAGPREQRPKRFDPEILVYWVQERHKAVRLEGILAKMCASVSWRKLGEM
jgi:hypothetical protein